MPEFFKLRNMNMRTAKLHGRQLCDLIKQAQAQAPIKLHENGKPAKKTPQQEAVIDVLGAVVRVRADQNSC